MSYQDYLFSSIDSDLPMEMLGCTISNEASAWAGLDSDRIGCGGWD